MLRRSALAAALLAALPAAAQAGAEVSPCPYAQGALRVETGVAGTTLAQGRDGRVADRESVFGMGLARAVGERERNARFQATASVASLALQTGAPGGLDTAPPMNTDLGVGVALLGGAASEAFQAGRARPVLQYNATLGR